MTNKPDNTTSGSFRIFLIWTFVLFGRPQDYLPFLQPLRIALVFTIVVLLVFLTKKKNVSWRHFFKIGVCKKYTLLYLLMIVGIPFADHRSRAFNFIFQAYLINMIYFFIFLFHVDSFKKIKSVIFTLTLAVLFYGVFGMTLGSFVGGRFKFGTMYDPNDMALFLVTLFPLSMVFLKKGQPFFNKLIAATVLVISPVIILRTGSRGGLLSLLIVFLLLIFTRSGGFKTSYRIVTAGIIIIISIIYTSESNLGRYTTLIDLEGDYNFTSETGRIEVWKTALKLISTHPLTGVGARCFPRAFGYAREAEGKAPIWKAAHNAYIQIWTEIGFPGLIVFLALVIGSLKTFLRFMRTEFTNHDVNEIRSLNGLIFVGFMGNLVGAFFLSQAYGILFTLFFALSGVMVNLFSDVGDAEQEKTTAPSQ